MRVIAEADTERRHDDDGTEHEHQFEARPGGTELAVKQNQESRKQNIEPLLDREAPLIDRDNGTIQRWERDVSEILGNRAPALRWQRWLLPIIVTVIILAALLLLCGENG